MHQSIGRTLIFLKKEQIRFPFLSETHAKTQRSLHMKRKLQWYRGGGQRGMGPTHPTQQPSDSHFT